MFAEERSSYEDFLQQFGLVTDPIEITSMQSNSAEVIAEVNRRDNGANILPVQFSSHASRVMFEKDQQPELEIA